ncbi:MAG: hypothetical protein NC110_08440, partial [Ruminococcus sp.]|nr:hypothetical protein [Ruminococcus sp.]
MAEVQHLCMGCMTPIHENAVICPNCGYNSQSVQHSPYLPKETVLAGRYLVGKAIAFDADNTTYIGFDLQRRTTVQIHEFLPEKIINRNEGSAVINVKIGYERMFFTCCQAFKKLWNDIANLPKPNAAETVVDLFDENATSYAVCEYIDAITLEEYFSSNPPLHAQQAIRAFEPVLSTLSSLHNAGIVHAAISPLTILLDSAGKLRLTGFSIAQTKSAIQELHRPPKDGYAPIELYDKAIATTASADIYSVAAVFYTAVTGIIPPVASQRALNDSMVIPKEFAESLPGNVIDAIVYAMRVYPQGRTKNICAFRSTLSARPASSSDFPPVKEAEPTEAAEKQKADSDS